MYFARFEGDTGERILAAIRLGQRSSRGRWPAEIPRVLSRGLEVRASSLALRLRVKDGEPRRVLLLSCPAEEEPAIRSVLDDLQTCSSVEAEPASDRGRHDEIAADFPLARRGWMWPDGYRSGPYRLATDFRLFPMLDRLVVAAATHGWDVAYQANLHRSPPGREDLRWLKKQLVQMELDGRFPAPVLDLQRSIVDRFTRSTCGIAELVGCGEEQSWSYLGRLVEDEFALPMRKYGFASPPLESGGSFPFEESLVTGFRLEMFQDTGAVARAAAALRTEEVEELLRWDLHADSRIRLPQREPSTAAQAFISYSSRNQGTALIVCEALERQGIGCWIAPRDILPGIPYPDAIMEGLRACKALVVLLSADASASPHVTREVEKAIGRKVPVIALRLDQSPLSDALDYLIGASQWLETTDPPGEDQLRHLARSVGRLLASEGAPAGAPRGGRAGSE